MIVIGIDPGIAITGFSIIQYENGMQTLVDYGCIRTESKHSDLERLHELYNDIQAILDKYRPHKCIIEKLYFHNNAKTAMIVGQARGVILLALSMYPMILVELTPLQLKNYITGFGHADKKQMQEAVRCLLKLDHKPEPDDAADAIGLALCGIHL